MYVIILEPNHVVGQIIAQELKKRNIKSFIAPSPDSAMKLADKQKPSLIISELSLRGHSTLEFLYEFRSYPDWKDTPVIVFSSLQIDSSILESKDWDLLAIHDVFYKPETSIKALVDRAASILEA